MLAQPSASASLSIVARHSFARSLQPSVSHRVFKIPLISLTSVSLGIASLLARITTVIVSEVAAQVGVGIFLMPATGAGSGFFGSGLLPPPHAAARTRARARVFI